MGKDYYRVLGVLDEAEDIVIKAAYKALAQRYHPDKWAGDAAEATRRMADINEAYGVLSDSVKRKVYDAQREKATFQAEPESDDLNSSLEADWNKVIEYVPDLVGIAAGLAKLSPSLVYSYKVTLLDTKTFSERQALAVRFENHYLEKYFGSNNDIKTFAKQLIIGKHRGAARELNGIISLLGSNVDAAVIIDRIREKFKLHSLLLISKGVSEVLAASNSYFMHQLAMKLLNQLGYKCSAKIFGFDGSFYVSKGATKILLNQPDLINFSLKEAHKYLFGE